MKEDCEKASIDEQIGSVARSESFEAPSLFQMNSSSYTNNNLENCVYSDFVLAKPEKVLPIYSKFKDQQVIVEGPERNIDLTYWLVSMQQDLSDMERGIKVGEFHTANRRPDMEYRILQRMTGHKDHVANLFVRSHKIFKDSNRHNDILPFKHSRVKLKENPKLGKVEDSEEYELNRYCSANYINSNVYSTGPAFIASQSPKNETVSHFWQMVWENEIKLITMLCPLSSGEKEESVEYWKISALGDSNKERVVVTSCVKTDLMAGVVQRIIVISDGFEERQVTHL